MRLQTDGGLKTGLDVIKAAIIGAESFGFGTAPMVALGCKYLRICHLNNCATGVATQHNILRAKYFIGLPEMVMNYFRFVARECREIMASLGMRTIAELIGSTELLEMLPGETSKQRKLDLSPCSRTRRWCRMNPSTAPTAATRLSTRECSASRWSRTCGARSRPSPAANSPTRSAITIAPSARASPARSPSAGATPA